MDCKCSIIFPPLEEAFTLAQPPPLTVPEHGIQQNFSSSFTGESAFYEKAFPSLVEAWDKSADKEFRKTPRKKGKSNLVFRLSRKSFKPRFICLSIFCWFVWEC